MYIFLSVLPFVVNKDEYINTSFPFLFTVDHIGPDFSVFEWRLWR